jgi:translation elongation factor EF-1alpha
MTKRIKVAVIGHLDHGKSTLIGRLLYDTNSISTEKVEEARKNKKDNRPLNLALFLDSFKEEREGRFTLDTTQVIVKIKKKEYIFIDVPGHNEFIKNMITGTSQAEYIVLAISAKLNEGIKAQTKAHLQLARLLGAKKIFVAVTKMDAVNYNKARFLEIKADIQNYLHNINFSAKAFFIPLSAEEGDNLIKRTTHMKWYGGNPLIKVIDLRIKEKKRKKIEPVRILIQDKYTVKSEIIFVGYVESGSLRIRDKVYLNLSCQKGSVERIVNGALIKGSAQEGECVRLVLEGIEEESAGRGEIISALYSRPLARNEVLAEIFFLNSYKETGNFILCCRLREVNCRIKIIKREGIVCVINISFNENMVIEKNSNLLILNRFILLDKKKNIVGLGVMHV